MSKSPYSDDVPRISMKQIFTYLLDVVNLDRGLLFTLKELALKPGPTIREYLRTSIRYRHIKPFSFLMLMSILLTFISVAILDTEISETTAFEGWGKLNEADLNALREQIMTFFRSYQHLAELLKVPFIAFATYKLFPKVNYNYAEHLVIASYLQGFLLFINFCLLPLLFLTSNSLVPVTITISVVGYLFWAYRSIFMPSSIGALIGKILLVFLFSQFIGGVVISLAIVGYLAWQGELGVLMNVLGG